MLNKILSIGPSQFLRGLSISPYDESTSVWDNLEGIDIYRNPGLLQSGYINTDLDPSGSIVRYNIRNMVIYPGDTTYLYAYGDGGASADIYRYNANTDLHVSGSSGFFPYTISGSAAQDITLYKDKIIFTSDLMVGSITSPGAENPTINVSAVATSLTDNSKHPMFVGPDNNLYLGDVNELDRYDGTTYSTNVLTLETGYTITCLESDGRYLIVGASKYVGSNFGVNQSKVFFWDTWSDSWNREYLLPDIDLLKLRKMGSWIYAFTRWGVYRFTYDNGPQVVIHEGTGVTNLYTEATGIDNWKGMLLWGSSNVWCYGSPSLNLPEALSNPFKTGTGGTANAEITGLKTVGINKIYVGALNDSNEKLYVFKADTSYGTGIAKTSLIDLKQPFKIWGVKLVTKALGSGDSIQVDIMNDSGTAIMTGTFSYDSDGAKSTKMIKSAPTSSTNTICDQIIIKLTFTGNVRVKRIDLFGTPQTTDYAER